MVSSRRTSAICGTLATFFLGAAFAQSPGRTTPFDYPVKNFASVAATPHKADPKALEVLPVDIWFQTTAVSTGERHVASNAVRSFVRQWAPARGFAPSFADVLVNDKTYEIEYEQGGRKFWVVWPMRGILDVLDYDPGDKVRLWAQHVGWLGGRPV